MKTNTNKAQHTPGQWEHGDIYPTGAYGENKPIKNAGTVIAYAMFCGRDGEAVANARLIAAAPELLDALVRIIGRGFSVQAEEQALAAIEKATGGE